MKAGFESHQGARFFQWERQSSAVSIIDFIELKCAKFAIELKLAKMFKFGVDVMITIFCDFSQFSAKKLAFYQKPKTKNQNLALF
jgi:hypothetical protein